MARFGLGTKGMWGVRAEREGEREREDKKKRPRATLPFPPPPLLFVEFPLRFPQPSSCFLFSFALLNLSAEQCLSGFINSDGRGREQTTNNFVQGWQKDEFVFFYLPHPSLKKQLGPHLHSQTKTPTFSSSNSSSVTFLKSQKTLAGKAPR